MQITDALSQLSRHITPLYIVGGAPRDALMGYKSKDIDLTGALPPQEVITKLASSPFLVKPNSLKLGTLSISIGTEKYEYTTLREDNYLADGVHQPTSVSFTKDIYKDALRRDFTINAIYYDIADRQFIDPLGGIADIKTKTIRTTREADKVFGEDALRILRLPRIACQTDCTIDNSALEGAKRQAHLIPALASERIQDELVNILSADEKNNITSAHTRGIRLLVETGAMAHIIPQLLEGIGCKQNKKYHIYDVFEHTMQALNVARADVRLAVLFHDIAKPYCMRTYASMACHAKHSARIARETLERLKFKTTVTSQVERLVLHHMFNLSGDAKPVTIRRFIQKNYDILDKLIALKTADSLASKQANPSPIANIRFQQELDYMRDSGIPLNISELKVNGQDALSAGLRGKAIGEGLARLLHLSVTDENLLSRRGQLEFLHSCNKRK